MPPKQYQYKLTELQNQFEQFKSLFKDIRDYILPRRGTFAEDGSPDQRNPRASYDLIIDDTATRSNRTAGAGLTGGLASPSRPWFRMGMMDSDLSKFNPVKEWLYQVEQIMYQVLRRSNFYSVVHSNFEEQAGFGTSPILQVPDPRTVMRFKLITAGEYLIANGANGEVDTLYRDMWLTARVLVDMFGIDAVSDRVRNVIDKSPFTYFRVIHVIEPRTSRDPNKRDNTNMATKSVWFEYGESEQYLLESGFLSFPGAVPRWSTTGNLPYGLAPGHDALGNVKMLQELQKTGIMGLHKMINPPMRTAGKFMGVLDLTPGANNIVESSDKDAIGSLYEIRLPLGDMEVKISNTQAAIERTYYTDLFLMLSQANDNPNMTATEVIERHEEKLLMLGPTVDRQHSELLDPILDRTFVILSESGLLPPPPKEAQGKDLKFEFISLLAQAQQAVTVQNINVYMTQVERVSALDQSSLHKTDFNEVLESTGTALGVPPKIMRSNEEAEERKQAEAEMAAQAAEAEEAAQAAQTIKDLGSANTGTDTALGAITEAAQR